MLHRIVCGLPLAVVTLSWCLTTQAGDAVAHPRLVSSAPADGVAVGVPPREVRLRFDEPVEAVRRGLRLYAAAGRVVELAPRGARGNTLRATLPRGLTGGYVVGYVVIGDDGHPTGGAIGFGVGADAQVAAALLERVRSRRPLDRATAVTQASAQAVAASALVAGAGLWLATLLGAAGRRARHAALTSVVALAGVTANLVLLVMLASLLDVASAQTGVTGASLGRALETASGRSAGLSALGWLAVAAAAYVARGRALRFVGALPVVMTAAVAEAAHGDLSPAMRGVLLVHLLAAAGWTAAVWCVVLAAAAPTARRGAVAVAEARRIRALAAWSAGTLAVTGALLALRLAGGAEATELRASSWVALVIAKAALALAAAAVGAAVWRTGRRASRRAAPSTPPPRPRVSAAPRLELGLLLLVAALAGAAATTRPPGL